MDLEYQKVPNEDLNEMSPCILIFERASTQSSDAGRDEHYDPSNLVFV